MALDLQVTLGRDRRRPRPPGVAPAQAARLLRPPAGLPVRRSGDRRRHPGGPHRPTGSGSPSRRSTPVAPSSRPTPRTTTRPPRTRTRCGPRTGPGWSSSARVPTGSARASSSTTAASTPRSPCGPPGYETVMVNCNPETVSTDYDTSDRLYFEPLTPEDLANVLDAEQAASVGRGPAGRGHREPRRADPAQAGRRHPRGAGARHLAGLDRPGRGPRAVERPVRAAGHPPTARGDGHHRGRGGGGGRRRSGTRCWCGPPTCSGGRAMEIVYDDDRLSGGGRGHVRGRAARSAGRAG